MVSHFGFDLLFLVTDDAEHLLTLADHVLSPLKTCLFRSFAHV